MAFAFGIPTVFIETNIRSVFLHFFFRDGRGGGKERGRSGKKSGVHDRDILPFIEKTLYRKDPQKWYYALMDYGVHLKQTLPNPSRKSRHHARQSPFKGSNREIRAEIVRYVLAESENGKDGATERDIERHIRAKIGDTPYDIGKNIRDLVREGFMTEKAGVFKA
jgi:A/G-specific adenine glycosylase